MKKVVLASASPRRRALLEQAGLDFIVCPSKIEEVITKSEPSEIVMALASDKANDVAASAPDGTVILGADTVVVKNGCILGKPKDDSDAKRMLSMLSGKTHQVYTGVCMIAKNDGNYHTVTFFDKTDVKMYDLSEQQIDWYIASKEPADKAGAYGIQGLGAVFIEAIHGDYNNVVGLPLAKVWQSLYHLSEV